MMLKINIHITTTNNKHNIKCLSGRDMYVIK